jgi:hypothetical protein
MRAARVALAVACLAGCAQATDVQKQTAALTQAGNVATRQIAQRRYDTKDEMLLLGAGASVLQDLGFLIEETSAGSGMLMATKHRDAVEAGQVAGQMLLVLLLAAGGSHYDPVYERDQLIRVSLTTRPTPDGSGTLVRANFQRLIWNNKSQRSRVETIADPAIYREFFEKMNQATFLQGQDI